MTSWGITYNDFYTCTNVPGYITYSGFFFTMEPLRDDGTSVLRIGYTATSACVARLVARNGRVLWDIRVTGKGILIYQRTDDGETYCCKITRRKSGFTLDLGDCNNCTYSQDAGAVFLPLHSEENKFEIRCGNPITYTGENGATEKRNAMTEHPKFHHWQ